MKRFNIFSRLLSLTFIALCAVSCQDDVENIDELLSQSNSNRTSVSEPIITNIYDYDDFMNNENPTACSIVEMGQYLVISGEELEGITSLTFHGLDIPATDFYAQWDMIVLSVPYRLPSSNASSSVVCTTRLGTTEHTVDLSIPDINIIGVTNEFQNRGEETQIQGSYLTLCGFDSDNSKIFLEKESEGYKTELTATDITDESVTITIPDDAPDNAYFTFEIAGEPLTRKLHYRPTDLFLTLDEGSESVVAAGSSYATIIDGTVEDDIDNIFGDTAKYYRFKGSIPSSTTLIVFYITDDFALEDGDDASNYNLVYEINTKTNCSIPTGNSYKFMVNNIGVNMWEDYSKVSIDTQGEWVTQRIDYSTVKANLTAIDGKHKFNIKVIAALATADHAFANFRIEPIIK